MANAKTKKRTGGHPAGRRTKNRPPKITPATFGDWVSGARLRTLPLAIAPVAAGTGASVLALGNHEFHWLLALGCLAVAIFLQIAVNYANDYSDGVRGTDLYRKGPSRLTGSGKAKPKTVLIVALVFFALAALAGIAVVVRSSHWWLLAVGAVAIVAAWFYTGGKKPYGYYALGELAVFIFFGLVATCGTQYVIAGVVTQEGWISGAAIGLVACAVLMVNNLRDREQDALAGKRTLSVLVGDRASRIVYTVMLLLPFVAVGVLGVFYSAVWLGFFGLLAALPAALIVITAKTARELVVALGLTSLTALVLGAAFALGFGV